MFALGRCYRKCQQTCLNNINDNLFRYLFHISTQWPGIDKYHWPVVIVKRTWCHNLRVYTERFVELGILVRGQAGHWFSGIVFGYFSASIYVRSAREGIGTIGNPSSTKYRVSMAVTGSNSIQLASERACGRLGIIMRLTRDQRANEIRSIECETMDASG